MEIQPRGLTYTRTLRKRLLSPRLPPTRRYHLSTVSFCPVLREGGSYLNSPAQQLPLLSSHPAPARSLLLLRKLLLPSVVAPAPEVAPVSLSASRPSAVEVEDTVSSASPVLRGDVAPVRVILRSSNASRSGRRDAPLRRADFRPIRPLFWRISLRAM